MDNLREIRGEFFDSTIVYYSILDIQLFDTTILLNENSETTDLLKTNCTTHQNP